MWGQIEDIMLIIIAAVISLIEAFKGGKKYRILWVIAFLVIVGLGIDQYFRKKRDDRKTEIKINKLSTQIDGLQNNKRADSIQAANEKQEAKTKNEEFETKLWEQFKIIRDSSNNPKSVNPVYNTHINTARDVNIGR